jgi:hypothetical protein
MRGQRGAAAQAALFEQRRQLLSCFSVGGIGREEADVNRAPSRPNAKPLSSPASPARTALPGRVSC